MQTRLINRWSVAVLAAIAILLLFFFGYFPKPRTRTDQGPPMSSVPALVVAVPCFEDLEILKCSYRWTRTTKVGEIVPGPSDMHEYACGHAVLSPAAVQQLKSRYLWKDVNVADLPHKMRETVPSGDCLSSNGFNQRFQSSSSYPWGVAVLVEAEEEPRLYFLISDEDHPIGLPSIQNGSNP